ncbi:FtsX-like permease family protein [Cocleimonas sp. KMM 6892]|uniref:ABC transporter permease n=1 Tax=unclassified Cocleimonas TaxID=2639732 RepID=UPI002DC05176|nr:MULTISPECIES: FtsX-like permease family protein [unclassified Cocleimonas]MEB8430732.1 FtsX-like permease family protein [Cocleimonas sp. KMM 6892]MEC4714496.1 FtsX-like permease family protein [Cocleimonas sp. KMM 6895]MEC4743829.1 FtsX-like permease family protein [Cocleimonas sp. KMM 6896]
MISLLQQFLIQTKRFWRLAETRLLFLALLVAVVAVTSVGFFTDRADRAMNVQATQLLGGDMVIVSTRPIDDSYIEEAEKRGLSTAITVSFRSMVSRGEKFQLAQVKAVSDKYPLHGEIETSAVSGGVTKATRIDTLSDNEIIADNRLFVSLGTGAGDSVQLGKSQKVLAKIINKMPDQASNAFQFAPTLIMPLAQLPETGLLTAASRANYSFLFAGNEAQIDSFRSWLKPRLTRSEKIRTLEDGMPAIQQALQRGQRFLKMAALLAVILAGAGIALSSYSLTRHETSAVAVLKTMGASRWQVTKHYLSQLLIVALIAGIVGSILGFFIQFFLASYLQDFIGQELPGTGWMPVWVGLLTAQVLVIGFSAPHLLQLVKTAPVQILQRASSASKAPLLLPFISLSLSVLGLMWLQTADIKLSLYLLVAVMIALAVFWVCALLLLKLIRKLGERWHLPKANRRMALMVVVFGVGLFSLLLLTTLRSDLIDRWQASLPEGAPNHFLINIQPNEVQPLKELLAKDNTEAPIYPMVRGRLVEVNDKAISPDDAKYAENQRAQRLLTREFNLSASAEMPEGNMITAGKWFEKGAQSGFSMEQGIADNLGVKMGDKLTFDIAGQRIVETITSMRTVQWDSMKPNFFVLAAPQAFDNYPKTFITSIYLDESKPEVLPNLIKKFPSVTDIDISAILTQVRDLINKAAFAVQGIFLFTLVAGVVVLFAALQSQKALRRKELAILKSLGANRAYLRRNLILEFAMIGGLAGFLAAVLALIAGNVAAYQLFELTPQFNLGLIILGTALGAVLVSIAGYLNVRGLLSVVPVSLFR